MKRTERVEVRNARLRGAMETLIPNSNFEAFIELVEELRDEAYNYAISVDSVKDQRLTLAAMGESRAYNDIVGIYRNYLDHLENRLDEQESD
jgi:hypothetical protein